MPNSNSRDKQPFLEGCVYDLAGQKFMCVEACEDQYTLRPYTGHLVMLHEIDPRPLSKNTLLRTDVDFRRGFWWGVNCICDLTEKFGKIKLQKMAELVNLAANMRCSEEVHFQYSEDFIECGAEILEETKEGRSKP